MGIDDKPVLLAEDALPRRPEDALQVAMDAIGFATWELDLDRRLMRGSAGLHTFLGHGHAPGEWTLQAIERHLFPDDLPAWRDALTNAWQLGSIDCQVRVRQGDGRLRWIALHGRLATQQRAGEHLLLGVVHDISDTKAGEQFLNEREAQFRAMFNVSSVGIAQADAVTGRLLRVNSRLSAMLGYRSEELVGRHLVALAHPSDAAELREGLKRLVRGDVESVTLEKRLLNRRGDVVWVLAAINLIRDSAGLPQRTVAVVLDIGERRRVERALLEREGELRVARDELEQRVDERTAKLAEANVALSNEIVVRGQAEQQVRELLGRLVQAVEDERGRISRELHDSLGQHLTALALGLKSIAVMPGCPPDVAHRLSAVQHSVRRLEDEVDLLSHQLRPPALDELGLDDALRSHAEAWAIDSGLDVEMHVHGLRLGRLPPAVETTVYRVAQEALHNIRKHAGASRVGLIVERRADEVRLIVEDDGCGFDTTAMASTGKRLGLRGMAERAALVAGQLEIESSPGAGTAVYLAIPVRMSDDTRPGSELASAAPHQRAAR